MGYSKLTYEEYIEHPEQWGTELPLWAKELSEMGYPGVSAIDFYDDIFGEDLEEERLPDEYVRGEYAGIAIERVKKLDKNGCVVLDKKGKEQYVGKRYTVTRGNRELYGLIDHSENFCMIAPISYAGRSRKNENARFMYALCIEVDYIQPNGGLEELIYSWQRRVSPMPCPTYMVCSGNGLHLYYVFERPIPLWKNVFESLTEAKKFFTPWFWNKYVTSASEAIEYESINQPFRCVGSRTKGNSYAMAFQTGKKVTIEYLNQFLPEELRLDSIYKSKYTLEQAKELYPGWYKRRIERGEDRGHYNRYQPIYYNWIDKILDRNSGAVVGKRYHCLENLCSLAVQCNIEPEQVERDCRRVAERFEELTVKEDNHFTEYDILCALKTYYDGSEQAYRRRIEFISKKTGIKLEPNKRNGRKQNLHLRLARANRDILCEERGKSDWREGNGRPSAEQIVLEWKEKHPEGKKADCIRETGLSKPTVYRWWKVAVKMPESHTEPSESEKRTSLRLESKKPTKTKIERSDETPEERKRRHYREWEERRETARKRGIKGGENY